MPNKEQLVESNMSDIISSIILGLPYTKELDAKVYFVMKFANPEQKALMHDFMSMRDHITKTREQIDKTFSDNGL